LAVEETWKTRVNLPLLKEQIEMLAIRPLGLLVVLAGGLQVSATLKFAPVMVTMVLGLPDVGLRVIEGTAALNVAMAPAQV
jgi:hypothetical protein